MLAAGATGGGVVEIDFVTGAEPFEGTAGMMMRSATGAEANTFLPTFFDAAFFAAALVVVAFLAGAFLATFLAAGFLAADFLATAFFAVVFFATDFFATFFFATVFLAADFFAVFLTATDVLLDDNSEGNSDVRSLPHELKATAISWSQRLQRIKGMQPKSAGFFA